MEIILILVFLFIACFHSIAFDRVIEYQFNNFHKFWVGDGCPRGVFFNPKNSSIVSFWIASFKVLWTEKPKWICGDNIAILLYRKLRFWDKAVKYYVIAFFPLLIAGNLLFEG